MEQSWRQRPATRAGRPRGAHRGDRRPGSTDQALLKVLRKGLWCVVIGTLLCAVVALAPPAEAGSIPGGATPGVTLLCSSYDYSCTGGGYTGSEPWGYYTAYGSRDSAGRLHNCTTYAAFRAAQNGAPKPNWWGNADEWDERARAAGVRVDMVPAVGAIAQWNGPAGSAGHVAYVESVDDTAIVTSDDNYSSMVTNRYRITRTSPSWPDSFIHLADVNTFGEGSFIQADDNNEVYRVVGGAPVYVSTWTPFGGVQAVTRVPRSRLNAMPRSPADGTFVAAGNYVYRFAGGAPLFVTNWDVVGGQQPATVIDPAAIANADHPSPWDHVRQYPADGTLIATSAYVFVVAGGAPVYVSDWAAIGGFRPATVVDPIAIDNADAAAPWNHLHRYPVDNTFVHGASGEVYRFAGGAPIFVSNWGVYGGFQPSVAVDAAALTNGDGAAPWNHVRRHPLDGTFLQDPSGTVYRVAGGAPLWISSWTPFGGVQPTVVIDPAAVAIAGGDGGWSHLRRVPLDGTTLWAQPSGRYWRMANGVLSETTATAAVLVNDESVETLKALGSASAYTLSYTDAERARMLQSAAYFGQSPENLPKWSVSVFDFLLAISNPRPARVVANPPSMAGTTNYVTTWSNGELPILRDFQAQYTLAPESAQKFAVNLVGFLLTLDGH